MLEEIIEDMSIFLGEISGWNEVWLLFWFWVFCSIKIVRKILELKKN